MQIMIKPENQTLQNNIVITLEKDEHDKFSLKIFNGNNSSDLELTSKDMHQFRQALGFLLDLY